MALALGLPVLPVFIDGTERVLAKGRRVPVPGPITLALAPAIDPGLLADERDATGMLAGLRVAREVAGSKAMQPWRKKELLPGAGIGDPERLRRSGSLGVYFHPVGTCKMGTDASAVTDLQLRVRGIDQLRVVDASVMPSLPGANTNATVLAIAERAADIIKRQN